LPAKAVKTIANKEKTRIAARARLLIRLGQQRRPADSNGVEAEVYLSSRVDNHPTDISLVLEQFPIATPEAAARLAAPPKEGFTIAPALVQPTLRGLRVADASVMPSIISGPGTNAASYMIGGRAAELIKADL
jgi:hypothetical protein